MECWAIAAFRPGWDTWPFGRRPPGLGTVTTGRAPMSALEPTPVADPRIWVLPRFSQNQTFSKAAGCAYRFHPRVYEIRLPQRHYLIFFELVALTININIKMLPIGVESLIIIQVTMPLWGNYFDFCIATR